MAGLLNKLMDFIGIEDAEMDDVYEDDYFADDRTVAEDNVLNLGNRGRKKAAAAGSSNAESTLAVRRWVAGSKVPMASISLSKNSQRTACSLPGE